MTTAKRPPLTNKEAWDRTKHVSWPPSWSKPLIRVPLPSGKYISKSIAPLEDVNETLRICILERDRIAVQIWGELRWREMLAVPKRSVAKHRKNRTTPRIGVFHSERSGRAPCWIAVWYELDRQAAYDGLSNRRPRRRRSKTFSYGTSNARYSTSASAYAAAWELRERMERRWYSVVDPCQMSRVNPHPDEPHG